MSSRDKTTGMKSAYEAALERLEEQGIARPREDGLDPAMRDRITAIRSRVDAKLAELEILLDDRLKTTHDPVERAKAEEEYSADRRRLMEQRDREIARLRAER